MVQPPSSPPYPIPGPMSDPQPMSLVAYDGSSDEEDAGATPYPAPPAASPPSFGPQPRPPSLSSSVSAARQSAAPPPAPSQNVAPTNLSSLSLPTTSLDLPDVADLFGSPSAPSRGSASMAGSSSRKREPNGHAIQDPRSKFPRSQSAQSRGSRNNAGNRLVPPQLSGRSNIVTEDLSNMFVARHKE